MYITDYKNITQQDITQQEKLSKLLSNLSDFYRSDNNKEANIETNAEGKKNFNFMDIQMNVNPYDVKRRPLDNSKFKTITHEHWIIGKIKGIAKKGFSLLSSLHQSFKNRIKTIFSETKNFFVSLLTTKISGKCSVSKSTKETPKSKDDPLKAITVISGECLVSEPISDPLKAITVISGECLVSEPISDPLKAMMNWVENPHVDRKHQNYQIATMSLFPNRAKKKGAKNSEQSIEDNNITDKESEKLVDSFKEVKTKFKEKLEDKEQIIQSFTSKLEALFGIIVEKSRPILQEVFSQLSPSTLKKGCFSISLGRNVTLHLNKRKTRSVVESEATSYKIDELIDGIVETSVEKKSNTCIEMWLEEKINRN